MRALVVDMVGVVGVWVRGVVCLVWGVGLEGVECVFVACEEGEWRVDCRVGGAGALGVWGVLGKKTLIPRGSFQNCGFQGGVNFVSKFMLKKRSA